MRNLSLSVLVLFTACAADPADPIGPSAPPASSPDPISAALPAVIAPSETPPTTAIALLDSSGPLVAWDFGLLQVSGLSPSLGLTVVNNTTTVSDVLQVSLTGSNANQFTLIAGADCAEQIQLAPGGTCTLRPRFSPTSSGAKTAMLTINGGAAGSVSILLSGTGAPQAILTTQPFALSFGVIEFGHPATETFTLVNSGVSINVQSISVGGAISNGAFSVTSTTCAGTLAASASCTIDVQFNPSVFGENYGNLTVKTDHGPYQVGDWVVGWGGARLSVQTTGSGFVYSDGGGYPSVNCGTDGNVDDDATDCTGLFITPVHALAASGNFLGWGGACTGSTASCPITLSTTAATVVTASFAP